MESVWMIALALSTITSTRDPQSILFVDIQNVKAHMRHHLPRNLRLHYNGMFLEDGPTLADYHIHKVSTLYLIPISKWD
ncbi:putative Ubiquitin domain-containing protein [Helianthus annuus]|nr:putative Ubiquitin domain-containing protein [Helianthus annuus]